MKNKITFKNHPREKGLAAVCCRPGCDLFLRKKYIGHINAGTWGQPVTVWVRIKSDKIPGWINRRLKAQFDSRDEAKQWVRDNDEAIQKLDLSPEE